MSDRLAASLVVRKLQTGRPNSIIPCNDENQTGIPTNMGKSKHFSMVEILRSTNSSSSWKADDERKNNISLQGGGGGRNSGAGNSSVKSVSGSIFKVICKREPGSKL